MDQRMWRRQDFWTILWRRNQLKDAEIFLILKYLMRGLRLRKIIISSFLRDMDLKKKIDS